MKIIDHQWPHGPEGLLLLEPPIFVDDRGHFIETYQRERYHSVGITEDFEQDNYSFSHQHVLRGLHIQEDQAKLVRCMQGAIFDVVVDLRVGSPTFRTWQSVYLDDENNRQLYIPPGFAHGFFVLSYVAKVEYKCSLPYNPGAELSVAWNDPDIGIQWVLDGAKPILSTRDQAAPTLAWHQSEGRFQNSI